MKVADERTTPDNLEEVMVALGLSPQHHLRGVVAAWLTRGYEIKSIRVILSSWLPARPGRGTSNIK